MLWFILIVTIHQPFSFFVSGLSKTVIDMAQVPVIATASRLHRAAAHLPPIKTSLPSYEEFSDISLVSTLREKDEGVHGQCDGSSSNTTIHRKAFNTLKRLVHNARPLIQRDIIPILSTILILCLFVLLVFSISSFPQFNDATHGQSPPSYNTRSWALARRADGLLSASRDPSIDVLPVLPKQTVEDAMLVAPSGVTSAKFRPQARRIVDKYLHSHSDHLGQLFGDPKDI